MAGIGHCRPPGPPLRCPGIRQRADMHKGLIIGWLVLALVAPAGAQESQGLDLSAPAKAEPKKPRADAAEAEPLDLRQPSQSEAARARAAPASSGSLFAEG